MMRQLCEKLREQVKKEPNSRAIVFVARRQTAAILGRELMSGRDVPQEIKDSHPEAIVGSLFTRVRCLLNVTPCTHRSSRPSEGCSSGAHA